MYRRDFRLYVLDGEGGVMESGIQWAESDVEDLVSAFFNDLIREDQSI